ncbi:hypothetical protein [Paenibacillus hunanensis]|uniref:Uncharacterized protein n=1 Tax=Paenibacillus hunanensis TaxID=539262 RepID=A0ABU1J5J3_9BACL|nr:hypothetical protein [Paenibacillus hunanensis]MDR6246726.1 hypothetical protein [Paenibacillus hunanensis]WPP43395.1 hypothetical protein SK066_10855 [Paenibacillus hunanensis]GGJ32622.1 hypothetical protein GCM10008022_46670 [Paenibacillus hunanensis]
MTTIIKVQPGISIADIYIGMLRNDAERCLSNTAYSFQIEYEQDKVSFIEINAEADISCIYNGIDLFKVKATQLIDLLDAISPYDRAESDGCSYRFPQLGLVLWRDINFTEEDMKQSWFQEMSLENQEDTMRSLYFSTVGVFLPE